MSSNPIPTHLLHERGRESPNPMGFELKVHVAPPPAHLILLDSPFEHNNPVRQNERMEGRLINVRRLVALDITLHGPRFIAIEFGLGTPAIIAVGIFLAVRGPFLLGLIFFSPG